MKVGVVGIGRVGAACALALVTRGSAREIVIVDRTRARAKAVATDLRYGAPLCPEVSLRDGDYADLAGASIVLVAAGVNVYRDIIPKIVAAAPAAMLLVVTDPPDPLADLTRTLARHDRVLGTGTLLDSLRFRVHLARRLGVSPASVEAQVVGEHGTSEVLCGVPVAKALPAGSSLDELRQGVEHDVRFANIAIIEGNEASQYGIGIASARIAEAVLRDERVVLPIGAYHAEYGVTLSLLVVVGRHGASRTLEPAMSAEERQAPRTSAEVLRKAVQRTSRHDYRAQVIVHLRRRDDYARPGLLISLPTVGSNVASHTSPPTTIANRRRPHWQIPATRACRRGPPRFSG